MGNFGWTDSQKQAIDKRHTGIVVSAAAGSGKTTVLIERLSQLLLDENNKIPAQNLLAVTFTTKAAAQMRVKLNNAIDKELVKCFSSPDARESERSRWLLEQKNDLQFAKVSTINSFCLEFVKDNISSFEFQSCLKILDESTEPMLFDRAYAEAMEELCGSNEHSYAELYNAFGGDHSDIKDILRRIYVFIRTIPFREQWIADARAQYTDEKRINEAIGEYRKAVTDRIEMIQKQFDALTVLCSKISVFKQAEKFYSSLTSVYDMIQEHIDNLSRAYDSSDTNEFLRWTDLNFSKPWLRNNKLLDQTDIGERSQIIDMCAQAGDLTVAIKKGFADIKSRGFLSDEAIKNNLKQAANIFDILIGSVERIEQLMYEAKLERNAVDFSDVEMMTKDLLVEIKDGKIVRTPLCEDIRSSGIYKLITIDEFQDVNNLQELIFRALSDGDDLEHMGCNAFVVGDIKQAIYRFRQTNPELFSKTVCDAEKGYKDLCLINLQENFRSRQGIIDFVNFIFSKIMYHKLGGVDYDSSQELRFGAKYYPQVADGDNDSSVELLLLERDQFFDKSKYSDELYLIAKKIKSMLAADSGYTVRDEKTEKMRHCRPSDFCVLFQTNQSVSQMAKALEDVGLKAFSQDSEGYLKASEITLALNILRVIDNPLNDIAMASMLMSPVFNYSASEMLRIHQKRIRKDSKALNGIYSVISNAHYSYINKETDDFEYERVFDDDKQLQRKCSQTYGMIENFVYRAMSTDLEKLIRYIFDATDMLSVMSLYLESGKKRANLLLFLQYARDYERSGNEGVSGFLRYIDSVYSNDKAFKQAGRITASGECINVMTFHASKGLEFPYVFLCDLSHSSGNSNDKIFMHYKVSDREDDTNCFSFEAKDAAHHMIKTNILHKSLAEQNKLEEKSERLRLLYVGCTRAREKLFISVSPKCNRKSPPSSGKTSIENVLVKADRCSNKDELIECISSYDNMLSWLMCGLSFANLGKDFSDWLRDDSDTDKKSQLVDKDELEEIVCRPSKEKINISMTRLSHDDKDETETTENKSTVFDPNLVSKLQGVYSSESDRLSREQGTAMLPSKLSVTEIVRLENEKNAIAAAPADDKGDAVGFNPDFFPSLPKLDDNKSRLTGAERGTFTHKFMELADFSLAEISVKSELERLTKLGYFSPKEASGVYTDRVTAFFESDFYARMKNADEIMREKKFMVAMKDINVSEKYSSITGSDGIIQGIADCVFKESDGYVIVDYKTDNFKSPSDMDKYGTQLEFYKAALELILGTEKSDGTIEKANIKSCYIYSFKLGCGKEFVF